jgi:hypothetical protein
MPSLIDRITSFSRTPAGHGLMRQVQERLSGGKGRAKGGGRRAKGGASRRARTARSRRR